MERTMTNIGAYSQRLSANNYLISSRINVPSNFDIINSYESPLNHEPVLTSSLDQAIGLSLHSLFNFENSSFFQTDSIHLMDNQVSISGGNLGYIRGAFKYGGTYKNGQYYIKGHGYRGNEFPRNIAEVRQIGLAETISVSSISNGGFVSTDQERALLFNEPILATDYANFGIEAGIMELDINNFIISAQMGWQQRKGLGYFAVGPYYAALEQRYAQVEVQKKNLRARGLLKNTQTKPESAFFYQSGKTFSFQSWDMAGEISYLDTLQKASILYEVGVDYRTIPTHTNNSLLGRNEDQSVYQTASAFLNVNWQLQPKTQFTSKLNYGYFNTIQQRGISFDGRLKHQLNKKNSFQLQYQWVTQAPALFSYYADLPIAITDDYDVWLSGNVVPQQPNTTPALISWTHPAFRPTPYQAGFSIQQAYNYVNEAAREQLQKRLIEINPRNRPLVGLLHFLLTEEFSPIGFINDFNSSDLLLGQPFEQSISGVSSAVFPTIEQLAFSYTSKVRKLQFESNIYFVREHHPVQLTMTSPKITLNNLGIFLGEAVQNRIQTPFEELLISSGGYSLEEAQVKAQEIGEVLNDVYAQQGDHLLEELNSNPFHGWIGMDRAVRQDKPQLMMGYATLEKSEYWGVDILCQIPIKDFATFNTQHHWINTTTYDTKQLFQEQSIVYYLNRPQYRTSNNVKLHLSEKWNVELQYNYESRFQANMGIYNGEVAAKSTVDIAWNARLAKNIDCSLNMTNIFDSGYQSYPLMPIIGRTFIMTLRYRLP